MNDYLDYGGGVYLQTVHFVRHGYKPEHLRKYPWVGKASINCLAEDLGLASVRSHSPRPFVVDDFGNLRIAVLEWDERQWVYAEEWDEFYASLSDERS